MMDFENPTNKNTLGDESPNPALAAIVDQYFRNCGSISEFEISEAFTKYSEGRLLFVEQETRWYVWNEKVWQSDDQELLTRRFLMKFLVELQRHVETTQDIENRDALLKVIKAYKKSGKLTTVLSLSKVELRANLTSFDANPWLLNLENGVYNLANNEFHPHDFRDRHSKIISIIYDPTADCPRFKQFLTEITKGNTEIEQFIQKAVGYSLTGLIVEEVLFFLHGSGANGKTTFQEVLRPLFGDYFRRSSFDSFATTFGSRIRNDIARLNGARLVTASEIDSNSNLDEVLVKEITGSDTITARYLHREHFEFKPQFKLWIAGNHLPKIRGTDGGIWRRIVLIPFEANFEGEKGDRFLSEKLKQELPGILNWAIEGCKIWRNEQGLNPPPAMRIRKDDYRQAQDPLAGFFSDRVCIADDSGEEPAVLYESYRKWCVWEEIKPISSVAFSRMIKERGFRQERTAYRRFWVGLSSEAPHRTLAQLRRVPDEY